MTPEHLAQLRLEAWSPGIADDMLALFEHIEEQGQEIKRLKSIRVCFHCRTFVTPEDDDGDCPECTNRAEALP